MASRAVLWAPLGAIFAAGGLSYFDKRTSLRTQIQAFSETRSPSQLTKLETLSAMTGCDIYAKREDNNPLGLAQARVLRAIVDQALHSSPHTRILVDATLSDFANPLREYLRGLGLPYLAVTQKLGLSTERPLDADRPGDVVDINFVRSPLRRAVHRLQTGPEIVSQLGDRIPAAFVCSIQSGGTIAGLGGYLRDRAGGPFGAWHWSFPQIFAAVPRSHPGVLSTLSSPQKISPTSISPLWLKSTPFSSAFGEVDRPGSGYLWDPLCQSTRTSLVQDPQNTVSHGHLQHAHIDGAVEVSDEDIVAMSRFLLEKEGLYVGPLAAMNVVAAMNVGLQLVQARAELAASVSQQGDRQTESESWRSVLGQTVLTPPNPRRVREQGGLEIQMEQLLTELHDRVSDYWYTFARGEASDLDQLRNERPIVVTIIPDAGWTARSSLWNSSWLKRRGLAQRESQTSTK